MKQPKKSCTVSKFGRVAWTLTPIMFPTAGFGGRLRQLLQSLSEKPKAAVVDLDNEPVKVNGTSKAPPKVRSCGVPLWVPEKGPIETGWNFAGLPRGSKLFES